jgi:phage tail-like protein
MRSSGARQRSNLNTSRQTRQRTREASELRFDPFMSYNFVVELEGMIVGGFSEVSGLESQIETEDYREGGVNNYVHHFPKQTTQSNLVLTKGIAGIGSLWDWYYNATQGIIQRKNGTIMMLNQQQIPVMWWNFYNAYPTKWTGPQFNASSENVAVEAVELVHEGLSKPLLSQALGAVQQLIS